MRHKVMTEIWKKSNKAAAILSAILLIFCGTKLIFALEPGFDGSNPYIKFERNLIKND